MSDPESLISLRKTTLAVAVGILRAHGISAISGARDGLYLTITAAGDPTHHIATYAIHQDAPEQLTLAAGAMCAFPDTISFVVGDPVALAACVASAIGLVLVAEYEGADMTEDPDGA